MLTPACASSVVTTGSAPPRATSTITLDPTTTTTTTLPSTTTTEVLPTEATALITPTGVLVPVNGFGPGGFEVETPCGLTANVASGHPLRTVEVVLDPGHGGPVDSGAIGRNGLREADLNLEVALATRDLLEEAGISVVSTRSDDHPVLIPVRARLADTLDAEMLISIHHNAPTASPSPVPGPEIFIQSDSERSRRLGGLIHEQIMSHLGRFTGVEWVAAPDAGVLRVLNPEGEDAYGMVRIPDTVAVLAEIGYIANPSEAELFATTEYVEVASEAIAEAVTTYLDSSDLGNGYVDEPRVFRPQRGLQQSSCEDPALG